MVGFTLGEGFFNKTKNKNFFCLPFFILNAYNVPLKFTEAKTQVNGISYI